MTEMDDFQVKELFGMAERGEISYTDLMFDLDSGGFDGDILDYLG